MKYSSYSILIILFLCTFSLWSQSDTTPLRFNSLLLGETVLPTQRLSPLRSAFQFRTSKKDIPSLRQAMVASSTVKLPTTYCAADLAFFCRLEVQMEKATKIPVRFRLGDVQRVDYLEGKYEGWRYGY